MLACRLDWLEAEKAMARRERIDEGEQVSAHYGIAGEHFKRLMLEAFGLSGFAFTGNGFMAAAGTQSNGGVETFLSMCGTL